MGTSYTKANSEVGTYLERVLLSWHPDLHNADVNFDLMFAWAEEDDNGDEKAPALKLHGVPCDAIVRIVSLKDRAKGMGDVEICFDGRKWQTLSPSERDALVDHEVTHVVLRIGKTGEVLMDDCGRPKLRMRPHDREHGWFDEVARRHKQAAPEVKAAAYLMSDQEMKQTYFPWIFGDDAAAA